MTVAVAEHVVEIATGARDGLMFGDILESEAMSPIRSDSKQGRLISEYGRYNTLISVMESKAKKVLTHGVWSYESQPKNLPCWMNTAYISDSMIREVLGHNHPTKGGHR